MENERKNHAQQLEEEKINHAQQLEEEKIKHAQKLKRKEREHEHELKLQKDQYNAKLKKMRKDMMKDIYDIICDPSLDTYKDVQVRKPELEALAQQYKVPRTSVPEMRRMLAMIMKLQKRENQLLEDANIEEEGSQEGGDEIRIEEID